MAVRTRSNDDGLILPGALPDGSSGAVWRRDGDCAEVLAELLDLQRERPS